MDLGGCLMGRVWSFVGLWVLSACAPASERLTLETENPLGRGDAPAGFGGGFDGYNQPSWLLDEYNDHLFELPLSGSIDAPPWSGSYWPKHKGGIAYRWMVDESHDFDLLDMEEIDSADPDTIAMLSPAEKYDLYVGNQHWALTHRALAESRPTEATWTGYCHGWASASAEYPEPEPVTVTTPDGIEIPFGSSDIKALLSYFRGEILRSTYVGHDWSVQPRVMGSVCGSQMPSDAACHDVNPGALHLALANRVGVQGRNLFLDVEPRFERWNQPIYRYQSKFLTSRLPSDNAAQGTVEEIIVQTRVEWTAEIEPSWDPVLGSSGQAMHSELYEYTLELDEAQRVIGGQWVTKLEPGGYITMGEAWDYLLNADRDGDGETDLTKSEAAQIIWRYFKLPDYAWTQDGGAFSEAFMQANSSYSFVGTTSTSRMHMYGYFGPLQALLEASLAQ